MTEYLSVTLIATIGRGENTKQKRAADVVAHPVNVTRDWSERGAVAAGILAAHGLTEHPEAQKRGPKGKQTETAYGVGFRVLSDAVRALVKGDTEPEAGVIRLSLSGEGGATVTLRKGDAGYDKAAALIAAASTED